MNTIFIAMLIYVMGGCFGLGLAHNVRRVSAVLISQMIATPLILTQVLPILWGASPLESHIPWTYPVGMIDFHIDALSAFFLVFSLSLTLLGSFYAVGYLKNYLHSARHMGVHFFLLNMTALSFVMIYSIQNAMAFIFAWELAAIAAWLLVIWDHDNQRVRFAGFNYLVSTHLSLLFLLSAFMIMYARTDSFAFSQFAIFLRNNTEDHSVIFLCLWLAFALKSACFPFHSWLPRAHAAAPAHISALMSGVIHKAGLYGLLRFTILWGEPQVWMGWMLLAFGLCSALVAVSYTLTQSDQKRLLGYSSTEHVGIATMGFGLGYLGLSWHSLELASLGFAAGILHILNHALFKSLLFYGSGCIYRMTHSVDLERLGGLWRKMPFTSTLLFVGGLAMAGLPPLNGFISEFILSLGLYHGLSHAPSDLALLILCAGALAFVASVSCFSSCRMLGVSLLGEQRDPQLQYKGEASAWMLLPMLLHAFAILLLGLWPYAGLTLIQAPVKLLLGFTFEKATPNAGLFLSDFVVLTPIAWISLWLVGLSLLLFALRTWKLKTHNLKPSRTWACAYGYASSHMQYTARSFSDLFIQNFRRFFLFKQRQNIPTAYFPQKGTLQSHCVDAVENQIFKGLAVGERLLGRLKPYGREDLPLAFSLGLLLTVLLMSVLWL